jgi:two-component system OmpR family response regulator
MPKSVLLIEDEPNIIEAIGFILSRAGYQVVSHGDGTTALDAVARETPNMVILDLMLPGRGGLDILRDLRAAPDTMALPVMMLTARGQKHDRDQAETLGVTAFMTKPFSNKEVLNQVQTLIGDV